MAGGVRAIRQFCLAPGEEIDRRRVIINARSNEISLERVVFT
jgi:hypothetical protein